MSYSESAKGITISRKRAFQELKAHGIDERMEPEFSEFQAFIGDRETISATRVLNWLGY